ncbi:MAG: energy-coupling factor ABC transporter permease [Clostridia bacterium]
MSHIHLPDGVLSLPWVILGYGMTALFLFLAMRKLKKEDIRKKVPYVGVIAALMLLTMSVPLGVIPFHLNLSVLTGILAGPALGFIVIFVVNVLLGFLGHGGMTVIGLNTLIIGAEIAVGSFLFRFLQKRINWVVSAGIATFVALILSTTLMVAVIVAADIGVDVALLPHHGEGHHEEATHQTHNEEGTEAFAGHRSGRLEEGVEEIRFLSLTGWNAIGAIILSGILIETFVSGLVINFFRKVRPDLISPQ